ncbi:hypothetical protein scyTo_0014875 [Scyliorhinus torazame]|uniref:Uncharacterized protein n=1 Tax=Scyliorhinus torazame TaxID=75743 RepID=A0A401NWS3_SCYTO|nr:hypothetical protein [Scyliorhinus torazame]
MGAVRSIILKLYLFVVGPVVGLKVIQSPPVLLLLSTRRQLSGASKFYYFSLLGLILIVPVCLLIMKSQCCKLKNGKDSSIHGRNLDDQIAGKSVNASVNEQSSKVEATVGIGKT